MGTFLDMPLVSNGYTLAPARIGRLQPTNPHQSRAALYEQFNAQGYLWLKGILDRDTVLAFRARVFEAMRETGLVASGTAGVEGIYAGDNLPLPDPMSVVHPNKILMEMARWAAFEAFCLAEPIWRFYEMFFEGAVYLHKRKILRYTKPNDPNCTGPHYDLVYLRGGTDRICTSWIPIGDTPVAMGGLVYLEGSDRWGRELEAESARSSADLPPEERISAYHKHMNATGWMDKDLNALAQRIDSRWLASDYEAGDMVIHSPFMIHASTMNEDAGGRMRLSADIRYQLVRDEIDVRWANHWSLDDML
ncbi:MAG: phytanoyl-CoA dioxygenase family protein [Chloroflexota bacterium]|nr:phytanoyl-CoA dioxygenase family protein [Chloroflexota bacterium]